MDKKRGINKRFRPKINNNHQTSPIFKGNNQQQTKNILKSEEKIMITQHSPLDQLDNIDQMKPNESIDASGILQKIESNTDLNWDFKREDDNKNNTNLISDDGIKISIKVNKTGEKFSDRSTNDIVITESKEEDNEKKIEEKQEKKSKGCFKNCCDKFCIFRALLISLLSIFLFFFIRWNMSK